MQSLLSHALVVGWYAKPRHPDHQETTSPHTPPSPTVHHSFSPVARAAHHASATTRAGRVGERSNCRRGRIARAGRSAPMCIGAIRPWRLASNAEQPNSAHLPYAAVARVQRRPHSLRTHSPTPTARLRRARAASLLHTCVCAPHTTRRTHTSTLTGRARYSGDSRYRSPHGAELSTPTDG